MTLDPSAVEPLAVAFLERQAWYTSLRRPATPAATLVALEQLAALPAGLARVVLTDEAQQYQLLVGWRAATETAAVLAGHEGSLLGPLQDGDEKVLAYEALADDELVLRLLEVVTGGSERAARVRLVHSLVSHASLVFDERLFMKLYRVLQPGTRPEVELVYRLDEVGFNAMLAPVARWRGGGFDLALVREFVANALEGRELALTSLRDLLAHAGEGSPDLPTGAGGRDRSDPAGAGVATLPEVSEEAAQAAASTGGDLAHELNRLGATTGTMHVALATAFGERDLEPEELPSELAQLDLPHHFGRSIRLHGDYHLRRVMRSEAGWLIAGFGDDPLYGNEETGGSLGRTHGTPLEDLADFCFSLRLVALEAVDSRPSAEARPALQLASAWVARNREAFLAGYASVTKAQRLVPSDPAIGRVLLDTLVAQRLRRYEAAAAGS